VAVGGAGNVIGPILGSGCYYLLGFSGIFYFLGICIFLFTILCSITQKPTKSTTLKEPLIHDVSGGSDVTIWQLLMAPRFLLAGLSAIIMEFMWTAMEPILAPQLVIHKLSQMEIGIFFALLPVAYMISGLGIQMIPKNIERRLTMIAGALMGFLAMVLTGPS
jgi:MFS family permease